MRPVIGWECNTFYTGTAAYNKGKAKMEKNVIFTITFMFVLAACGQSENTIPMTAIPTLTPSVTPTSIPTATPEPMSVLAELDGSIGPIYSISWSPEGNMIASTEYGQVNIWDAETKVKVATLEGHNSFVWGVAFSPNGELIASASVDGTVRIWDAHDFSEAMILENSGAFCLAWSPDGKQVAVGSTSGRITIWDLDTQEIVRTLSSGGFSVSNTWSPDGSLIAAGRLYGKIAVWDAESGKQIILISEYSNSRYDANGLAFSPDGTILASANQDGYTYLWNVENWELQSKKRQNSGWVRGIAWSPDGKLLASTGEDAKVRIWNVDSDQSWGLISISYLPIWSASWSPNGNQLAAGSGTYDDPETSGSLYLISVPR